MAALITLVPVAVAFGVMCGAYVKICFAIRSEDRRRQSLRRAATSRSAQAARSVVGITGSRWG